MKKILIFILFLFPLFSYSEEVKLLISNYKSNNILLYAHYGNKKILYDNITTTDSCNFIIKTDTLKSGMYMIASSDSTLLINFLLDEKDKSFSLSFDSKNVVNTVKVRRSKINKDFHEFSQFIALKSAEILPYKELLQAKDLSPDETIAAEKTIFDINTQVETYTMDMIDKHNTDILGLILLANLDANLNIDKSVPIQKRRTMLFQNFWQQVDFNDERLLRSPFLHYNLEKYLNRMLVQSPDSICDGIDKLLAKLNPGTENTIYILNYITNKYENSTVMGQDKIFVHIVDRYYSTNYPNGSNPLTVEAMQIRADEIRPTLIGKIGSDLRFLDRNMKLQTLYDIDKKYTIIYFWNSECPFCEEYTEELVKFYNENYNKTVDFEIYGVFTGRSIIDMAKYIDNKSMRWINVNGAISPQGDDFHKLYNVYSTPYIYVLDRNKKIIAKKIRVEDLKYFLKL